MGQGLGACHLWTDISPLLLPAIVGIVTCLQTYSCCVNTFFNLKGSSIVHFLRSVITSLTRLYCGLYALSGDSAQISTWIRPQANRPNFYLHDLHHGFYQRHSQQEIRRKTLNLSLPVTTLIMETRTCHQTDHDYQTGPLRNRETYRLRSVAYHGIITPLLRTTGAKDVGILRQWQTGLAGISSLPGPKR